MSHPVAALETQRHTERRVVVNQQPMIRRNQRDATAVNQTPRDRPRQFVVSRGGVQGRQQIVTGESFVQISERTEKLFRITLRELSERAPIVRADVLRFERVAQCAGGEGRLCPRAAISLARDVAADGRVS